MIDRRSANDNAQANAPSRGRVLSVCHFEFWRRLSGRICSELGQRQSPTSSLVSAAISLNARGYALTELGEPRSVGWFVTRAAQPVEPSKAPIACRLLDISPVCSSSRLLAVTVKPCDVPHSQKHGRLRFHVAMFGKVKIRPLQTQMK